MSVWAALSLAIRLLCQEVVLYFNFHGSATVWNFALVVLTLLSDNNELSAILRKAAL